MANWVEGDTRRAVIFPIIVDLSKMPVREPRRDKPCADPVLNAVSSPLCVIRTAARNDGPFWRAAIFVNGIKAPATRAAWLQGILEIPMREIPCGRGCPPDASH